MITVESCSHSKMEFSQYWVKTRSLRMLRLTGEPGSLLASHLGTKADDRLGSHLGSCRYDRN
jgi:hypothetical protein